MPSINGKQKDSVQKEMLAFSSTTIVGVERKHGRPLAPRSQTQTDGRTFERKKTLRGSSPSGRIKSKCVQTLT